MGIFSLPFVVAREGIGVPTISNNVSQISKSDDIIVDETASGLTSNRCDPQGQVIEEYSQRSGLSIRKLDRDVDSWSALFFKPTSSELCLECESAI